MSDSTPQIPPTRESGGTTHESATTALPPERARASESESQTYENAAGRVEEIIRRLDSGEASLNETLELVKEGKALIELCARELAAVGDALEELRLDELVSRLESDASA